VSQQPGAQTLARSGRRNTPSISVPSSIMLRAAAMLFGERDDWFATHTTATVAKARPANVSGEIGSALEQPGRHRTFRRTGAAGPK